MSRATTDKRRQWRAAGWPETQGDKLDPNRAGYAAMANSIDLNLLRPPLVAKKMSVVAK